MIKLIRFILFAATLPACVLYDAAVLTLLVPGFLLVDLAVWSWGERADFRRYRDAARDSMTLAWIKRLRRWA